MEDRRIRKLESLVEVKWSLIVKTLKSKNQVFKFQSGRYRQPVDNPQNRGHIVKLTSYHNQPSHSILNSL